MSRTNSERIAAPLTLGPYRSVPATPTPQRRAVVRELACAGGVGAGQGAGTAPACEPICYTLPMLRIFAALVALVPAIALADMTGQASVIDGDTLEIAMQRANQDLSRHRRPNVLPFLACERCYPGNLSLGVG